LVAAFGFEALAFGFAAAALGFVAAAFAGALRPSRSGLVEGRLASTLGCASVEALDFFALPDLSLIVRYGTLA
jgi:hypothetical protein